MLNLISSCWYCSYINTINVGSGSALQMTSRIFMMSEFCGEKTLQLSTQDGL